MAEVDTETGKAVLRRVVTVDDAGTVVNPLTATADYAFLSAAEVPSFELAAMETPTSYSRRCKTRGALRRRSS